ncbi:unnamed protein product [Chrysodeixis includens]|uniref:Uncharacterized protein n=1 Tax=Chrysodeixis includens TaxID=689277 RepID=A0A9N8Q121_CHRIL|nr:unnamed protein product [Chrysodeixis includens]
MEEKEREWKRARTARSEYATDVEDVQAWVRAAELTARDRTLAPEAYRERLVATRAEVPNVADRVERLTRNAKAIVEGSRDAGERQLVQSTVTALSEQFSAVCSELEARQAAVEDACDAVARFLTLLEKVLLWVETQRAFLARPLPLADLQEAQQKQTEYGNALKSCKQQAKNLADMAKEIEAIERVTSPGDLPSRLEAAENATVDVEKRLAKTNGLLQELAEEWERCERKLKDVGHWLEATSRTLEAPQNAKKPLRDRLALREKLINDISTQKTKISYAVEKLNVHFGPDGVAAQSLGPAGVEAAARSLGAALDALAQQTGAQAAQLARALAQVDAYCADVGRLRAQLLQAEQQLRHAAQPNYSPREPERAQRQQQEVSRRIEELTGAIYALDPYFVMPASDEHAATLSMLVCSASHARSSRRARSGSRRGQALAPPAPPPRPRSPCWAPGGFTYAEIVKGSGSRSSSRGSRGEPAPYEPSEPLELQEPYDNNETSKMDNTVEVVVEPCVVSERIDDEAVSRSDNRVCESISVSETYGGDVNVYYEDLAPRSEPELVPEYYTEPPVEYREVPIDVPTHVYQESPEPITKTPEVVVKELQTVDLEKTTSPDLKDRQHELSYAEILALGLRKQPRTQSVTSLPKPQVAQIELVKEIVVECVEKSPPILQHESKVEKIEPPRFKPERSDRLDRPERLERPPTRSRSREMPRQRRAPEKRPTKAHDVQAMKKKKTMKKVIEVQDFDEFEPPVEVELKSIKDLAVQTADKPIEKPVCKEVTKKLQHSATVVETVTEIVTEDSQPDSIEEVEHTKPKKKQKSKKPKSSEDEIQKALKEIEELEKSKKKKTKESRDKSKEAVSEPKVHETVIEPEVVVPKILPVTETEKQSKPKKKKGPKTNDDDVSNKTIDVKTDILTVESSTVVEITTKEPKPKKKKNQKQSSLDKSEKSEHSSFDSGTNVTNVDVSEQKDIDLPEVMKVPKEIENISLETKGESPLIKEIESVASTDDLDNKKPVDAEVVIKDTSNAIVTSVVTSEVAHKTEINVQEFVTELKSTKVDSKVTEITEEVTTTSSDVGRLENATEETQISIVSDVKESKEDPHELKETQQVESVSKKIENEQQKKEQIDTDEITKKATKSKKKSSKNKSKPIVDTTLEFISKESIQEPVTEKVAEKSQPEKVVPEIPVKDTQIQAVPEETKPIQDTVLVAPKSTQQELATPLEIKPEPIQSEEIVSEYIESQSVQLLQELYSDEVPLPPTQSDLTPEIISTEQAPVELSSKADEEEKPDASKNKKKRKQKKQEKIPDPVVVAASEIVEIIEEDVKSIEPVVEELPNVVEQVEEQKPLKKKKSKKGKNANLKEDIIETSVQELKESEDTISVITEVISQEITEIKSQEDSKKSKKTTKSKVDEIVIETPVESNIISIDEQSPSEINTEEAAFEEVKSHKKKKSKKQKINDDDIDKALKEIERSGGTKKKPKEKVSKPKAKTEKPTTIELETNPQQEESTLERTLKEEDDSLAEELDFIQPVEHIDWNAMLEEEEGISETTYEPSSHVETELALPETGFVANQVTILQETTNILLEKERTDVTDIKETSVEAFALSEATNIVSESTVSDTVTTVEQSDKQSTSVTTPANEQNNNDKFFSPDAVKEGSYNIVEEITCYEPITQDVETRTIYLITHEEKKLPPIRTVKVFSSKSNSLEEPLSVEDDVVVSDQTISNKITDVKSSINVSENVDSKVITETFIKEEKILDSVNITEAEPIKLEEIKSEKVTEQVDETKTVENIHSAVEKQSTESIINVAEIVSEEVSQEGFSSPDVDETPSKTNEPSNELLDQPQKPLTEEDFSDILEEAIFGSVQDRNRVQSQKKPKDKFPSIPYEELINEVKPYSKDLDTYQLDYEYTQLIISQRESQNLQSSQDLENKLEVSQPELTPAVKGQDNIQQSEVVSKVQSDIISPVKEEAPKVSYQEVKDAEVVLAELSSKKETNTTHVSEVPIAPQEPKSVDDVDACVLIAESDIQITSEQLKPEENRADKLESQKILVNELPTKATGQISSVHEETPRISYHEIRDAEIILASQVSNKTVEITSDENIESVSDLRVSETDSKPEVPCMESHSLVETVDSKQIESENVRTTSYHEIKDAEVILATQSKPEQSTSEQLPQEHQNLEKRVEPLEDIKTTEDRLLETFVTNVTKTVSVTEVASTFITTESAVLQSINDPEPLTDSEKPVESFSEVSEVPEQSRVDINLQFLREDTPRYSYHEINDAERRFALTTSEAASNETSPRETVEITQVIQNGKVSAEELPEATIEISSSSNTLIESNVHSFIDTGKDNLDIPVTDEVIKPTENVTSVPVDAKIQKVASVDDVDKETKQAIFEAPRTSYQEISDAECLLATIITKSREASEEKSVVESVPITEEPQKSVVKPEPSPPSISEIPRYSYHELTDAENLLATKLVSSKTTEEVSVDPVTQSPTLKDKDSTAVEVPNVTEELKETPQVSEAIYEPLRHSYQEIKEAELILASSKSREASLEPQTVEEKTPTEKSQPSTKEQTKVPLKDDKLFKQLEPQNVPISSPVQKAPLDKIALSFEVDDLSNTPITVVYGNEEDGTPTVEVKNISFDHEVKDFVKVEAADSSDKPDVADITDSKKEIQEETVLTEEETFEIIDHSDVTGAIPDEIKETANQEIREIEAKVTEVSTKTELPRSITPKTSDDHQVVQDLIEEALKEPEPIPTRSKPAYETFVIDDLNESLVPVVFGDLKDIEKSIKYKKQELLLQTIEPESEHVEPQSPDNITAGNEILIENASSPIEIVESTEEFTIPQPSEYADLDEPTDVSADAKPDTISAELLPTDELQSELKLSDSVTFEQPDINTQTPTDSRTETIITSDVRETELTNTETISRVEKSPIHSLHDLLPEIDSIPEFKPSYSNTVLYSKLSADAPEFTPSYMYQTTTTVSESRTEVEDAPAPITVEEETIEISTEGSTTPQISYSSILQTKKEQLDIPQSSSPPSEKIITETVTTSEVHDDHIESKSKKNKKKKKKEKEDKKDVAVVKKAENIQTVPLQTTNTSEVEPVNVWAKAAEEGKTYADVLAEGLAHEQKEFLHLVSEKPVEKDFIEKEEKYIMVEKVASAPATSSEEKFRESVETVTESDNGIGSWAKIVGKRSSPENVPKIVASQKEPTPVSAKIHPPVIFVDESSNDHQTTETEIDAEGFITVDRSRRSRSKSRDKRSQSNISQTRETREKSENRFEALTTSLKPDDVESTQSPSDDEKPLKKPSRKSRSSKSREKDIKPSPVEVAPSTSDEDKQPPKRNKKKRSSKSKDTVSKDLEGKIEPSVVTIEEPPQPVEEPQEKPASEAPTDQKKKSKKKKKDKKPVEAIEDANIPTTPASEEKPVTKVTIPQKKKLDTPTSTPESIQTPIKDRVFSEAQFWKDDPSSLDLSEIISVEIQHTPTESYKIEIKDGNIPKDVKPEAETTSVHSIQSASQFITQEISAIETQRQELVDKIAEDQSLESKMADLQREIEEMLSPENDSSVMSDDSPKELTDTQTSMEYQYDELMENLSPSLATPEPDNLDLKSVETQLPEELDDKHISMSMIDSLLEDTEPISITETHSLEHTDDIQVTQEDMTPRVTEKVFIESEIFTEVQKQELSDFVQEPNVELKEVVETKLDKLEEKPKDPVILDVTAFIESEKSLTDSTITESKLHVVDSIVPAKISKVETEKVQEKPVLPENIKLSSKEDILIIPKDTDNTQTVSQKDTVKADVVSKVPLSNTDVDTNNLINLKSDSFWTDKHKIHDAEVLLIERKSVERTIKPVEIDQSSEKEDGISVEQNIIKDKSFWPDKYLYHDAECQYFLLMARKPKTPSIDTKEIEMNDENDKDRDQGGSSGHSSEGEEPKDSSGSSYDPDYISMDLPGGICSWKDKSSYLSVETPVVDDASSELVCREDILTTLPIAPAPSSSKQEPEQTPPRTTKVTDPQSYCTILNYILYVWHDIITKFLISQITKLFIVMCLATPQLVL